MKISKYRLTFLLVLTLGVASAHQDFSRIKDFGNIKVRITTGYHYEEMNKAFLFGQLAQKLAKELAYSKPIFLDFHHHYTHPCDPDYFLSYDKGKIDYTWSNPIKGKGFLKKKALVVRQVAPYFDAQKTLKLLEYAIRNAKAIKSTQQSIAYNQNYCQWQINSIDTVAIKKALDLPNSKLLNTVLKTKIERPEEGFRQGISYYWKDNRYTLFVRQPGQADIELKTLDHIYDLQRMENSSAAVFDTNHSFYYIENTDEPKISIRQIIEATNGYYRLYKIEYIDSGNQLSIAFQYYSKPRKLIYWIKEQELMQNLN